VYPGPQTEAVDTSFGIDMSAKANFPALHLPALAQFGYIVVTVGNRGGHPTRSRAYQDFSYGNSFRDYGLADKKTALEQLAARHSFIDIDKVGIYGHSGGGFMSTAAMLVYPDFFKVAVSSAGNHDNNIYNRWWSERFSGAKEETNDRNETTFKVALTENPELARNLKGRLMLATGEIDNNVHPAGTYRMVEALINAGKRFDMLVIPSAQHGFTGMAGDYFFWARADYFNKYLLGSAPDSVDMVDLMREIPQTKK
jgi:dipeptidyl aminopeptidase/acylaminoacyl peptidase